MAATLVITLVALIVAQGILVLGFAIVLLFKRSVTSSDDTCPKAAVILCLRGGDPFLQHCVAAILDQDYPTYDLRIIVDSEQDPAWQIATQCAESSGSTNVLIQSLRNPRNTCSLKCSSVVQAISDLDDSYEVVALLDADTVPHRTWLRELVAPLANNRVGATTGNRWYMPDEVSVPSLIRYIWNAAAIVQMYWFGIAWGGSLAIKTSVLRESGLLERWSNAFCEDTMVFRALRHMNLRLEFVPTILMVNRESCDLAGYFRWVRRQLLTARLYHPNWFLVLSHGVSTTLVPLAIVSLLIVAIQNSQASMANWLAIALAISWVTNAAMVSFLEVAARRVVARRGEPTRWLGFLGFVKYLMSLPITQLVYSAALSSSLFVRNVGWRGISYQIRGPWDIRMVEYRPYETCDNGESRPAASL
ncbi:MAG: glycosyltransferase family 2 protein [Planctomycetaceae bacterium]|nr:glycosyltransferase family 2 protein [Planctomycetales bacterium]MCB9921571.1 glycosyltransferase family 2 protein [Planctomycetaceae bacterium]